MNRTVRKYIASFVLFSSGLMAASAYAAKPNPNLTPGALCTASDPSFRGYGYSERIPLCSRSVTIQEKAFVAQQYGVPRATWHSYEFDHLVPLCAGGSSVPANLWPQPIQEARRKDVLENQVCREMRVGRMTQRQAIAAVTTWFQQAGTSGMLHGRFSRAAAVPSAPFDKVMVVYFENANYRQVLQQPFFTQLTRVGALLTNFHAETHPSQPNYIAFMAGDTLGFHDDLPHNVNATNLVDLLEAKGKSWKVYAEDYPGGCFTGARSGNYVRKHNPLISFEDIYGNPSRCANIVDAQQAQLDARNGNFPDFSFYIPNLKDDGHDTGAAYADRWFQGMFGPLFRNPRLMNRLLVIATFDEGERDPTNQVYTVLIGSGVRPGSTSAIAYDHYSLLRTIEVGLGLGSLGRNDARVAPVTGIWK